MGKHFYSHIIETSSISLELGDMDLSKEERIHLMSLMEATMHNVILDVILSELSEEDKKIFLTHLSSNNHDKIWEHLKKKIDNIEEKIRKAVGELKDELYEDIKEAKDK
ncbi:MAG: hypothetical protein AAB662_04415 [Patescibacteria group bacterium]